MEKEKDLTLIIEKKKQKKNKQKEVPSSEFDHESKSEGEISTNKIVHIMKKMMRKCKKFNWKYFMMVFQDSTKMSKGKTKTKSSGTHLKFNRKEHYKSKCLKLHK